MLERGMCFSTGQTTLSGPVAVKNERLAAIVRNLVEISVEKREMRLFETRSPTELRLVASSSATQSLWLRDRKVRSQIVGKNRRRHPEIGAVGEVMGGGRRKSRASNGARNKIY